MLVMLNLNFFKTARYAVMTPLLLMLVFSAMLFSKSTLAGGDAVVKTAATSDVQLPDPLQAGWEGVAVCEQLYEDETNRTLRCTFPPGVGHEKHYHRPHFGYALSGGQMRLTDADGVREMDLKTDMSYYSGGVDWHEVLNIGETTVQYLIVEQK